MCCKTENPIVSFYKKNQLKPTFPFRHKPDHLAAALNINLKGGKKSFETQPLTSFLYDRKE